MAGQDALWRLIFEAKPEGLAKAGGDWRCRCPAHQDRVASLAIKVADDGRLLLHCHAGCSTEDVLRAWGVEWSVLFPGETNPNGSPGTFSTYSTSSTFSTSPTGPTSETSSTSTAEPEAVYDYVDESRSLLFQVCRYRLPDGSKTFRQRHPWAGGWAWNMRHVRRVLYRLPEILAAGPDEWIFVVEGEKDADRLASEGLRSTTNPGGAGKWGGTYSELLRGRRVALIPDNDGPGRAHMAKVQSQLQGVASEVRILDLLDLAPGGDVTDWLEAGNPISNLRELAEVSRLSTYIPTEVESRETERGWNLVSVGALMAEEDTDPPDLVEGLLPWGGLSVVGAKPKAGKSTLARCLAICVAQGRPFLGRATKQGPVFYLALEEKRSEVRNHFRDLEARPDDPLTIHFGATPDDALASLARLLEEAKPVLCIIDPLFRFTRVKDASAYAEISNALDPVLQVARRSGTHILLVHHNTKIEREGMDDLLGSTAIAGSVDTAFILRRRSNGMRFAYSIQRYGVDMPSTVLELRGPWVEAAGSLDHVEADHLKQAVIDFLAQGPAAELAVRENVEGNTEYIAKALRGLVNDGQVGRSGNGKRGDPFVYSLVPVAPTTPGQVCPVCGSAERDVIKGRSPSWRCLGCGQLYGQLPIPPGEQVEEVDPDNQVEKVPQDEEVEKVPEDDEETS